MSFRSLTKNSDVVYTFATCYLGGAQKCGQPSGNSTGLTFGSAHHSPVTKNGDASPACFWGLYAPRQDAYLISSQASVRGCACANRKGARFEGGAIKKRAGTRSLTLFFSASDWSLTEKIDCERGCRPRALNVRPDRMRSGWALSNGFSKRCPTISTTECSIRHESTRTRQWLGSLEKQIAGRLQTCSERD